MSQGWNLSQKCFLKAGNCIMNAIMNRNSDYHFPTLAAQLPEFAVLNHNAHRIGFCPCTSLQRVLQQWAESAARGTMTDTRDWTRAGGKELAI